MNSIRQSDVFKNSIMNKKRLLLNVGYPVPITPALICAQYFIIDINYSLMLLNKAKQYINQGCFTATGITRYTGEITGLHFKT